jgi:hypothetical protein
VRPVDHFAAFCETLTQSDDRWEGQPLKRAGGARVGAAERRPPSEDPRAPSSSSGSLSTPRTAATAAINTLMFPPDFEREKRQATCQGAGIAT